LHWPSAVVLVVGVALSFTLALVTATSIRDSDNRLLRAQIRQVDTALQAVIPAIQQPLIAADRIEVRFGVAAFGAFVRTDVGNEAPFRSISLWQRTGAGPRLLLVEGIRPELLSRRGAAARFLGSVRPSPQLWITGLTTGHLVGLGFAEVLPGTPRLIVYAESPPPAPPPQFAGIDFSLYLGRSSTPSVLMESTQGLSGSGTSAKAVVGFGNGHVTIVTVLARRPSGVLPRTTPWVLGAGGLALAVTAAATTERLTRRRVRAERLAIDRTAQFDTQRGIAETLQHSLLPAEEPSFPGVRMAARYVAGVKNLEVGGDWYDAISIDDEHLFLTVGDVSGRGLRAATVMATLRHAIKAYAVQGDAPDAVLQKLGDLVDVERDQCFATVICAALDVPRQAAVLASAGHLPPLLVDARGARFLPVPVNAPVGVASTIPRQSARISLAAGSSLVLYTDGLVERRDRSLDDGLERLRRAVPTPDLPIDQMLTDIVDTLVPAGTDDDVALLGLQWAPSLSAAEPSPGPSWRALGEHTTTTTRRFTHDDGSVRRARAFVSASLEGRTPDELELVEVLVSELATNAVRHAATNFEVVIVKDRSSSCIRVGITDEGSGIPVQHGIRVMEPHGRGLQIVGELADDWGVEWSVGGSTKTVWFELGRQWATPS
jgi:serine phosphatase RsbU (regulator of sigma subunit)/anti-sigma regulatory factor (Ser/Thr protein kinase)